MRARFVAACFLTRAWFTGWLLGALAGTAWAQTGVFYDRVQIGMVAPLTGSYGEVGQAYLKGARACAEVVNRAGGVFARRIVIKALDDFFQPAESQVLVQELFGIPQIEDGKPIPIKRDEVVLAMIGVMSAANVEAVAAVLNKLRAPLVGAYSGSPQFFRGDSGWVFPVRAPDSAVFKTMFEHMRATGQTRAAVLVGRDSGSDVQLGLIRELAVQQGVELVAVQSVELANVELATNSIAELKKSNPHVMISLVSYSLTASLVRSAIALGYRGQFYVHSDVGTVPLTQKLGSLARGVVVIGALPHGGHNTLAFAREYRDAMSQAGHTLIEEASLEGCLAARVLIEGLRRAGPNPTREGLRSALTRRDVQVADLTVLTSGPRRGALVYANSWVLSLDGRVVR